VSQLEIATFIAYALLILAASLAGGVLPMLIRMTHRRLQVATSVIAGFMLGVAVLHLLPHAMHGGLSPMGLGVCVLVGVLAMFGLERVFSYHHHTVPAQGDALPVSADPELGAACDEPGDPIDHSHGHGHNPAHSHAHSHGHAGDPHLADKPARLSWIGIAMGLVIHSLIAGATLAAVMIAEAGHSQADPAEGINWLWLPGVGVFLAIFLHKPFDSMALLTLLKTTGWSKAAQHWINGLFGLTVPLGAVLFFLGATWIDAHQGWFIAAALAVSAGVFLCVSLADLLPEVHFHTHDRGLLSLALAAGLALAIGIAWLESNTHAHAHGHGQGQVAGVYCETHGVVHDHSQHDHSSHDHSSHDHSSHDHSGHDHAAHENKEPRGNEKSTSGGFFQTIPR